MPAEHLVFLHDEQLPSIKEWQAALDEADTGIILGKPFDLRTHDGLWRVTHRLQPAQLEWSYGPIAEHFGGSLPPGVGKRTHASNFVTHGDRRDLACALLAAAVLAQVADGVVFEPHSGGVIDGDTALRAALDAEKHLRK